jgi:hypothetical protein
VVVWIDELERRRQIARVYGIVLRAASNLPSPRIDRQPPLPTPRQRAAHAEERHRRRALGRHDLELVMPLGAHERDVQAVGPRADNRRVGVRHSAAAVDVQHVGRH